MLDHILGKEFNIQNEIIAETNENCFHVLIETLKLYFDVGYLYYFILLYL